ncbi:MAG TPA: hypothetical protein VIX73_33335 [Kofleriaceae bacterium]|jgi:hypothetical protein
MAKNTTIAAAVVTIAVVIPAGWHALDADIQSDGKRLRPLQQSFTVDGTRITLDVDRHVVMTGDTVTATLVAHGDAARPVVVDLWALHSSNYEGARVEQPWIPIDREVFTLTPAPKGGRAVTTRIALGERPSGPALVDSFKIYVTPHGKKPPRGDFDDRLDYDIGVSEGYAAAIGITGWSGDNLKLSIKPEGRPTGDAPFTVAVRVKNTSGQALAHRPYVSLGTAAALEGTEAANFEDAGVVIERIEEPANDDPSNTSADVDSAFSRGETMVARYRVTPKKPGLRQLTFLASAFESDQEPGPTTAGAMDARTFALSEATPSVAAR